MRCRIVKGCHQLLDNLGRGWETFAFTRGDESVSQTCEGDETRWIPSLMPPYRLTGKNLFLMFRPMEPRYGGSCSRLSVSTGAERRTTPGMLLSLKNRHHSVTFHCWGLWLWGALLEFWLFRYKNELRISSKLRWFFTKRQESSVWRLN